MYVQRALQVGLHACAGQVFFVQERRPTIPIALGPLPKYCEFLCASLAIEDPRQIMKPWLKG
jgi:hypothetical protein